MMELDSFNDTMKMIDTDFLMQDPYRNSKIYTVLQKSRVRDLKICILGSDDDSMIPVHSIMDQ